VQVIELLERQAQIGVSPLPHSRSCPMLVITASHKFPLHTQGAMVSKRRVQYQNRNRALARKHSKAYRRRRAARRVAAMKQDLQQTIDARVLAAVEQAVQQELASRAAAAAVVDSSLGPLLAAIGDPPAPPRGCAAPWWCLYLAADPTTPELHRLPWLGPPPPAWRALEKPSKSHPGMQRMGKGSFGKVYAGTVQRLSDNVLVPVAVKVPKHKQTAPRYSLHLEAKALETMAGCEQVVDLMFVAGDGGLDPSGFVKRMLVMELNNTSLRSYLGGDKKTTEQLPRPLVLPRMLRLLLDLFKGLDAMHAADLAHNDIKPANVGVVFHGADGPSLKLFDLGGVSVSSLGGRDRASCKISACTPHYAPHERRKQKHPDKVKFPDGFRSTSDGEPWQWDMFSAGVTALCVALQVPGVDWVARAVVERMGQRGKGTGGWSALQLWDSWRGPGRTQGDVEASFGKCLKELLNEEPGLAPNTTVCPLILRLLSVRPSGRPKASECVQVINMAINTQY
jgi:serine/threonine protein kinase